MTYDELDAIPENGGFDVTIREDGVHVPVARRCFALYHAQDDYLFARDRQGRVWSTGTGPDGKKYKNRLHLLD